jgi:hypothetical protein
MPESYHDRLPDVETKGFKLWKLKRAEGEELKDLDEESGVLTIDASKGETMYESRVYDGAVEGYSVVILSKMRGDKVFMLIKGKRPDGEPFLSMQPKEGWLTKEEYTQKVKEFEEMASPIVDTANPRVTPGRLFELYAGGE